MALAIRSAQTGKKKGDDHLLADPDHDSGRGVHRHQVALRVVSRLAWKALIPGVHWFYNAPPHARGREDVHVLLFLHDRACTPSTWSSGSASWPCCGHDRAKQVFVGILRAARDQRLYWHFVDIVWIFLFPLLYLIGGRVLTESTKRCPIITNTARIRTHGSDQHLSASFFSP